MPTDIPNGEPAWKPRLNPDLKVRIVDGEAIVLDRDNQRVHQLNETATFIIQRCDGTRSIDQLVAALLDHYDVTADVARSNATETLSNMRVLRILI
jgi:methyltransferase-like protein